MNEILGHGFVPIDYPLRPDFGGTPYPFFKEIKSDKITFGLAEEYRLTKVIIPSRESFMAVSVEDKNGGVFLDAFYNFIGQLEMARIWFKSYFLQTDFHEVAKPTRELTRLYKNLDVNNKDLIFEANIKNEKLKIIYVEEKKGEIYEYLYEVENLLPVGQRVFIDTDVKFIKSHSRIRFAGGIEDNILSIGFCPNNRNVVHEQISLYANPQRLRGSSNPLEVRNFLENVFLKEV